MKSWSTQGIGGRDTLMVRIWGQTLIGAKQKDGRMCSSFVVVAPFHFPTWVPSPESVFVYALSPISRYFTTAVLERKLAPSKFFAQSPLATPPSWTLTTCGGCSSPGSRRCSSLRFTSLERSTSPKKDLLFLSVRFCLFPPCYLLFGFLLHRNWVYSLQCMY